MSKNIILLNEQEQQELMNKEFKNKKILNVCALKWFGPEVTPDELKKVNGYLNLFYVIKQRFSSLTIPELVTFFNRYPNFKPTDVPDATKYTLEQMLFILNEYYDLRDASTIEKNTLPEIFRGKDLPATPERQEASKNMLWFNTNLPNLIINEDGFRVYEINNQAESKAFGYYLYSLITNKEFLQKVNKGLINQWCITKFDGRNMYSTYRPKPYERSYYFAIDESKSPEVTDDPQKIKYYLSVIQYTLAHNTNFVHTSMFNDGDMVVSKEQLLNIFPKLDGKFDLFKYTEYDEAKELGGNLDIVDRITEDERNPYAFFKMNKMYKERYIRKNKIISKKQSWLSMSDDIRTLYINLTDEENYLERFPSSELMIAIKENKNNFKTLIDRLEAININIGKILTPIYSKEFKFDQKVSLLNRDVSLFQSRDNQKYGIFHKKYGDWFKLNGIEYNAQYTRIKTVAYKDADNRGYFLEHYSKSNNPDDINNFYIVVPYTGNRISGYFMSKKMFDELTKKDDAGGSITGFVPDEKSDLKEIKKGF